MDPSSSISGTPRPQLSLVAPAEDSACTADVGCTGDICVFFEPDGTVVRLYGRVDRSMRKEMVEAAFDVVGRGAPVTIDVAPDAEVHPGALTYLQQLFLLRDAPGRSGAAAVPHPRGAPAAAGSGRRPAGRRLPMARQAMS